MADEKEISQTSDPEIEQKQQQQQLPEFEISAEHPEQDDTRIRSEKLRYENADRIY